MSNVHYAVDQWIPVLWLFCQWQRNALYTECPSDYLSRFFEFMAGYSMYSCFFWISRRTAAISAKEFCGIEILAAYQNLGLLFS